jgi:hypothetical protein
MCAFDTLICSSLTVLNRLLGLVSAMYVVPTVTPPPNPSDSVV